MKAVPWRAVVLLLALLLLSALVLAPARVLVPLLAPAELSGGGYTGTVWRGSAARVVLRLPAGNVYLGSVHWALRPLSLLRLRPALSLRSQWGEQRLALELQWLGAQSLRLREAEAVFSAAVLRQLLPVELEGRLSLQLEQAELREGLLYSARGRAVWEAARWRTAQADFALGTYALHFGPAPAGEVAGVRAEVITLAGPLETSGELRLERSDWSVALDFGSERPLPAPLSNALSLLAAPSATGYSLRLQGELPVSAARS